MASMDDDDSVTGDLTDEAEDLEELELDELLEEEEGSDEGQASAPPVRQSPALGPMLLLFACGGWLVWAVLHFGADAPAGGPGLAVVDGEPSGMSAPAAEEPASAPAPDATESDEEAATDSESDEPGEPALAPEETPWVESNWTEGIDPPRTVSYVVKRGGQLKNVANLFKIYHHEILELNPGLKLDQELAPGTEVVVYQAKEGQRSESIGTPGRGSLEGPVPMMDGPGRSLKMVPWKSWATGETVATLDRVLREWRKRYPDAQPILVGNMSAPTGGKLKPHSSHQSGRDVDLGYPQIWDRKEELNWREMSAKNLHLGMTWDLLKLLVETGAVEHVFIDTKLQKLLYEYAKEKQPVPKRTLSRWLEYPRRPGTTGAIVQHVPGHTDHIHVRFACPPDHARCKTR